THLRVKVAVVWEQLADEGISLGSVERFEQDRGGVQLAAAPPRPSVEQLGPGQRENQDGSVATEIPDVLNEVEQCRLTPMQVIKDDHQRLGVCGALQELAHSPRDLGW